MDANSFFIGQQVRQLASRLTGARQQVSRAQTLRQVRDAGHVPVPSYLGPSATMLPEMRQLRRACETRAEELVDGHLTKLIALAAEDKPLAERIETLKAAYGSLRQHEWVFLRGEHATLYGNATRKAEQLISQLQRQAASRPD